MPEDLASRRAFLALCGTAIGSAWLATDRSAVMRSFRHKPARLDVLTAAEAEDLGAIASLIVPSDGSPGAREAKVVDFCDHALATWASDQRQPVFEGLTRLNSDLKARWPRATRFAALRHDRQLQVLRAAEDTPFFHTIRFLTVLGMFSLPSYRGNAHQVGWRMIGFESRHAWEPPFGAYDAEAMERPG
jgi:hypothetical protein